MRPLGDAVLDLAASSRREFVMCAPFAKAAVVREVLAAIPEGVQIALYTRWRPDEVAAGVSDTEVLPAVRGRGEWSTCMTDCTQSSIGTRWTPSSARRT